MAKTVSNTDDLIDIRDVIARFEELEADREEYGAEHWAKENKEDGEEYAELLALLEECKGNGGDEQWRGDWYPLTLIRDDYFKEYAQELAEGIGAVNADAIWPNNCIDWDQAARELRMDYTSVAFAGMDYWTR